jgi:hypothetical protein
MALTKVPEDEGEEDTSRSALHSTAITNSIAATNSSRKEHTIEDRLEQLQAEFDLASASSRHSDNPPPRGHNLPSTHAHEPPSDIRSGTQATPPTQPAYTFFTSTPPCTQPRASNSDPTRTLSRHSTDSSIETISSFSSTPSPSLSLSWSSTPSSSFSTPAALIRSNDAEYNEQEALSRIHNALPDMIDECRTCWVDRVVTRPHSTYHCAKKTLQSRDWEKIKSGLRFPSGVLCFYCLVPYEAPFYHERAPNGSKQTPKMCEYPDALKELVYIIYENQALRKKVFAKLGIPEPTVLRRYMQYVTAVGDGQLPAAYKIIDAYLRVREEEEFIG